MVGIPRKNRPFVIDLLRRLDHSESNVNQRNATACLLGLHGLRIGEVCQLQLADLKPRKMAIFVRTLKEGPPSDVPIDPETWRSLLREARRSRDRHSTFLLSTRTGNAVDRGNLRRWWRRQRERTPIKSCRFHDFRHAAARTVFERSNDPFVAKKLLRHRKIETTFIYLTEGAELEREWLPTWPIK